MTTTIMKRVASIVRSHFDTPSVDSSADVRKRLEAAIRQVDSLSRSVQERLNVSVTEMQNCMAASNELYDRVSLLSRQANKVENIADTKLHNIYEMAVSLHKASQEALQVHADKTASLTDELNTLTNKLKELKLALDSIGMTQIIANSKERRKSMAGAVPQKSVSEFELREAKRLTLEAEALTEVRMGW